MWIKSDDIALNVWQDIWELSTKDRLFYNIEPSVYDKSRSTLPNRNKEVTLIRKRLGVGLKILFFTTKGTLWSL